MKPPLHSTGHGIPPDRSRCDAGFYHGLLGHGSSEDDCDARHRPCADPGPGSGLPQRQPRDRLADSDAGGRPPVRRATLRRFDDGHRGKAEKGMLRRSLGKVSGLLRALLTRLVTQRRTTATSRTGAAPRGDRSRAATPEQTSGCSPGSTRTTARCPRRPRARSAPALDAAHPRLFRCIDPAA